MLGSGLTFIVFCV
jgi:uncharacterized membrane protein